MTLDTGGRQTLEAVADVLIPSGDGMPSASAAGVGREWLDAVLRVRPDFGPLLAAVVEKLRGGDPATALEALRAEDPAGFGTLAEVVAGAYFLNPEVRRAIGYGGQRQVPIVPENPPDYEQDGLLASVVGRGSIFRPTPGRAPERP